MDTPDTRLNADGQSNRRYPTLGVDAVPLARYDDVEAETGDLLVYDVENEDAWIQSTLSADRADSI